MEGIVGCVFERAIQSYHLNGHLHNDLHLALHVCNLIAIEALQMRERQLGKRVLMWLFLLAECRGIIQLYSVSRLGCGGMGQNWS